MSTIYEALEKAEIERNVQKIVEEENPDGPRTKKEILSLPSRQFDLPSFPLSKRDPWRRNSFGSSGRT